jgi:hypothetical protein
MRASNESGSVPILVGSMISKLFVLLTSTQMPLLLLVLLLLLLIPLL